MRDLVLCLQGCLEITRPSLHAEGGDTVRSGTQASRQQMPVCQASGLWALSQEADKPCGCPSGHTLRRGLRGPALNCLQGPFHLLGVPQPLPRARAGCLHPHPHPHVWSQHLFLDDPQTANPQHTQNQVPPALVSHTSLPPGERVLQPPTWRSGLRMLLPPLPPPSVGSLTPSSPPSTTMHPLRSNLTAALSRTFSHSQEDSLPERPPEGTPGDGLWQLPQTTGQAPHEAQSKQAQAS